MKQPRARATNRGEVRLLAMAALNGIVMLNVGGRHFDTTRDTLEVSRYFERFLDDDSLVVGATRDEAGRCFIDRDPIPSP